jgi:hypothetical protein
MMNRGDLDELLDELLRAVGSSLVKYQDESMRHCLGAMREAVRKVYEAAYNDCPETFNLGVRIAQGPTNQ